MPLEEPSWHTHSIDEIQYGKEIADKIQQSLQCEKKVGESHQTYFDEIERPISDFVIRRWSNDIDGVETFISGDLRPDIASELQEATAKIWQP